MILLLWVLCACVISALVSGGLIYFVMASRSQVLLSKQREELAGARAALTAQKETIEGALKNVEDSARSRAMEEFLADIRVEERHYVREQKVLFLNRKSVIRQERIFFRNIPLSNWVEQEMPFEEGTDVEKLVQAMSVFSPYSLFEGPSNPIKRLLRRPTVP